MTEGSMKVFEYVKSVDGADVTSEDIANATGLTRRQVDGSVTAAFCRKGLMERVEAEIELENGKHKAVKFIKLTEAGKAFDPTAKEEK